MVRDLELVELNFGSCRAAEQLLWPGYATAPTGQWNIPKSKLIQPSPRADETPRTRCVTLYVLNLQVSMVAKPGRNYALNKPVTIAELSSGSEGAVDYERERLNLRKRHQEGATVAKGGANARNNQSRQVRHKHIHPSNSI